MVIIYQSNKRFVHATLNIQVWELWYAVVSMISGASPCSWWEFSSSSWPTSSSAGCFPSTGAGSSSKRHSKTNKSCNNSLIELTSAVINNSSNNNNLVSISAAALVLVSNIKHHIQHMEVRVRTQTSLDVVEHDQISTHRQLKEP